MAAQLDRPSWLGCKAIADEARRLFADLDPADDAALQAMQRLLGALRFPVR